MKRLSVMIIRKARIGDLKVIFRLYLALEKHYDVEPSSDEKVKWKRETLDLIKKSEKGGVLIAVEGNAIVGYLSYYFVRGVCGPLRDCVFLSELYVKSRYRKMGVAGKLVRRFFRLGLPDFVKRYVVTTSFEAGNVICFYEKMGFVRKSKTKAGNVKLVRELVI